MPAIEEEFRDVLQNIESAVVGVYRANPDLLDAHVDDALDGLLRLYQAEARGRATPNLRFSPSAQAVFTAAKAMCDWRLGRETLVNEEGVAQDPGRPLTLDEMAACLKRLRRSVEFWTRKNGRQGYLRYVNFFL